MDYRGLPSLPGMERNGQVYYNRERDLVEALLPNGPFASCHAPDLLELADGSLLCCWFAGTREGNADISIVLSRLDKGSTRWSEPIIVSDDMTRSEQNPSLFQANEQELWVMYTAQQARIQELPAHTNLQYTAEIRRRVSRDGGKRFDDTKTMFADPGSFCRQKIQKLSGGRWLFSTWHCFDDDTHNGSDISCVWRSDDAGKSWQKTIVPDSQGCVHGHLVERPDGTVLAFFRSRGADHIYRSVSRDGGVSFSSPEPTELPNNNAGISVVGLRSGAIAVAYNGCRFGDDRAVARWPRQRAPIVLAISEDEGLTFPYRRVLELSDGYCGAWNGASNRRCEYPVLMQGRDGRLHVAYAWDNRNNIRYAGMTEDWIRGQNKEEGLRYDF